MKNIIISSLLVTSFTQSVAFADKQDLGTLLGGALGGLLGNELVDGKVVPTIIGVVGGAVIGNQLGKALDDRDRLAYADAQRVALEGRVNDRHSWDGSMRGSRSGARGEIIILREGRSLRQQSTTCREYQSVINVGRRQEVNKGIACRRSDGSWYEVKEQEVSFGGVVVESQRTEEQGNVGKRRNNNRNDRNNRQHDDNRNNSPYLGSNRSEYKCVSRDNDGARPYILSIRNRSTYEETKISNLVFSSVADCERAISESTVVARNTFVCSSRDRDGSRPYSLYTLDGSQASKLSLTFSTVESCKESITKARTTRQVVALCSSRDNDGSRPWSIYTIDHDTRSLSRTPQTYSSVEECFRNL